MSKSAQTSLFNDHEDAIQSNVHIHIKMHEGDDEKIRKLKTSFNRGLVRSIKLKRK